MILYLDQCTHIPWDGDRMAKFATTGMQIISTRLANIYGYHVEKTWSELKLKTF